MAGVIYHGKRKRQVCAKNVRILIILKVRETNGYLDRDASPMSA